MKSNVTLLRRASSPTFGFGVTAGTRAPLSWIASRPIVGTIGCRRASGAGDCGNCGFMVKVSVSLAQVSNSALLPVAPAFVLTSMKSCQATLSGSFTAEFASGGAACAVGFPMIRMAPQSSAAAQTVRFMTPLPDGGNRTIIPVRWDACRVDAALPVSEAPRRWAPRTSAHVLNPLRGKPLAGSFILTATYHGLNVKANSALEESPQGIFGRWARD